MSKVLLFVSQPQEINRLDPGECNGIISATSFHAATDLITNPATTNTDQHSIHHVTPSSTSKPSLNVLSHQRPGEKVRDKAAPRPTSSPCPISRNHAPRIITSARAWQHLPLHDANRQSFVLSQTQPVFVLEIVLLLIVESCYRMRE